MRACVASFFKENSCSPSRPRLCFAEAAPPCLLPGRRGTRACWLLGGGRARGECFDGYWLGLSGFLDLALVRGAAVGARSAPFEEALPAIAGTQVAGLHQRLPRLLPHRVRCS
jgi:hypothetical protein